MYDAMYEPDFRDSGEDVVMLEHYMEEIRKEAIQKLSNLELAAIFEDFEDFRIRYREHQEEEYASWKAE